MKRWIKRTLIALVTLVVIVASLFAWGAYVAFKALSEAVPWESKCEVELAQNTISPDGTMDLIVEHMNCSGETDISHLVYIVSKGKPCGWDCLAFKCFGATAFQAQWLEMDHVMVQFCSENDPDIRVRTRGNESIVFPYFKDIPKPARWFHPQVGRNMTVEIERRCDNE